MDTEIDAKEIIVLLKAMRDFEWNGDYDQSPYNQDLLDSAIALIKQQKAVMQEQQKRLEFICAGTDGTTPAIVKIARLEKQIQDQVEYVGEAGARAANYREQFVWLYNQGYLAGHEDTAEGRYIHILPADIRSYHSDVISDLISPTGQE